MLGQLRDASRRQAEDSRHTVLASSRLGGNGHPGGHGAEGRLRGPTAPCWLLEQVHARAGRADTDPWPGTRGPAVRTSWAARALAPSRASVLTGEGLGPRRPRSVRAAWATRPEWVVLELSTWHRAPGVVRGSPPSRPPADRRADD